MLLEDGVFVIYNLKWCTCNAHNGLNYHGIIVLKYTVDKHKPFNFSALGVMHQDLFLLYTILKLQWRKSFHLLW